MRILHLNTTDYGGAAWCAMRISKALSSQGVECRFLIAEGTQRENVVVAKPDKEFWYSNYFLGKVKHLLMRTPFFWDKEKMDKVLKQKNSELEKPLFIHGPYSYYKNVVNHPLFEWADIIHLHWVPEFIDYPTFFRRVNKPIVWTLHDKFPAVGVQHVCLECSPVPIPLQPIDRLCRKVKRKSVKYAKNLNLVAISNCMANLCARSEILRGFPVTRIHNGIDGDIFQRYNKVEARHKLGLPLDMPVFMFSSFNIYDKNKGLKLLIEALNEVGGDNLRLICIGDNNTSNVLPQTNYQIIQTGLIRDQHLLSLYYSAADFYVQCSFEESFGQTPLEAMSCGTPVVAFPSGVIPEIINDNNGVLCRDFTVGALAEGIKTAMQRAYDGAEIRKQILSRFSYDKIAQQYIMLYESILKE